MHIHHDFIRQLMVLNFLYQILRVFNRDIKFSYLLI